MKVFWTHFAINKLQSIFEYYHEVAGRRVATRLVKGIVNHTEILKKSQHIGQIEELLLEKSIEYRYLIYKNYKIIYWVNNEKSRIEISTIFDCRQNPSQLNTM